MHELSSRLGAAIMLMVLAAAAAWGRAKERQTAAVLSMGWGTLILTQIVTGRGAPPTILAIEDLLVFAALFAILWRSREGWAPFALGLQAVAMGVHAVRWLAPGMSDATYLTALAVLSYGVLAALAWGVWRLRATGAEAAGRS